MFRQIRKHLNYEAIAVDRYSPFETTLVNHSGAFTDNSVRCNVSGLMNNQTFWSGINTILRTVTVEEMIAS